MNFIKNSKTRRWKNTLFIRKRKKSPTSNNYYKHEKHKHRDSPNWYDNHLPSYMFFKLISFAYQSYNITFYVLLKTSVIILCIPYGIGIITFIPSLLQLISKLVHIMVSIDYLLTQVYPPIFHTMDYISSPKFKMALCHRTLCLAINLLTMWNMITNKLQLFINKFYERLMNLILTYEHKQDQPPTSSTPTLGCIYANTTQSSATPESAVKIFTIASSLLTVLILISSPMSMPQVLRAFIMLSCTWGPHEVWSWVISFRKVRPLHSNAMSATRILPHLDGASLSEIEMLCDTGANCSIVNNRNLLHDLVETTDAVGVTGGAIAKIDFKGTY